MSNLTHEELTNYAGRWLEFSEKCRVVITEAQGVVEKPDAIGFTYITSVLVEAKVSRSDFMRDKDKFSRKNTRHACGQYRYYICENGLITMKDLPARWGLLYVNPNGSIYKARFAYPFEYTISMMRNERNLLLSAYTKVWQSKKRKW